MSGQYRSPFGDALPQHAQIDTPADRDIPMPPPSGPWSTWAAMALLEIPDSEFPQTPEQCFAPPIPTLPN